MLCCPALLATWVLLATASAAEEQCDGDDAAALLTTGSSHKLRPGKAEPPSLNVHVEADAALSAAAVKLNQKLSELCPSNDITFGEGGCCNPHNTLYMTAYQDAAAADDYAMVGKALEPVSKLFVAPCNATMKPPYASGAYVMWDLEYTHCMDSLGGATVSQLQGLALQNQEVPGWVNDQPEPTRTQKATCVELYGSPNVFFQYSPHITLGYVDDDCKGYEGGLAAAVEAMYAAVPEAKTAIAIAQEISYAVSGKHGTVPQSSDLGGIELPGA